MKRTVMAGVLVAACFAVGRAQAADDLALPVQGVITNPDWESRPSGEDMSEYYPKLGQMLNLAANALMSCTVASDGSLHDCSIVSEHPLGIGAGVAALQMAPLFRMKPRTVDGAPVDGGNVRIPLAFALDDGPASAAPTAPQRADLPAATLAVARQLADLIINTDARQKLMQDTALQIDQIAVWTPIGGQAEIEARKRAVEAAHAMAAATPGAMAQILAERFVRIYSEAELRQILAFAQSPAGRHWLQAPPVSQEEMIAESRRVMEIASGVGARRFCEQADCIQPKAAPAKSSPP